MVFNSITDKVEQTQTAILQMLKNEIHSLGLLSDVEEVYFGMKQNNLDYPSIWIIEEGVKPKSSGLGPRSDETDSLTVNFYCLEYDGDDPSDSYKLSRNLALRVVDTIEKHCLITDTNGDKVFDYVRFVNLRPFTFPIGSSNTVTEYCVQMEFGFRRRRTICRNNNNSED